MLSHQCFVRRRPAARADLRRQFTPWKLTATLGAMSDFWFEELELAIGDSSTQESSNCVLCLLGVICMELKPLGQDPPRCGGYHPTLTGD